MTTVRETGFSTRSRTAFIPNSVRSIVNWLMRVSPSAPILIVAGMSIDFGDLQTIVKRTVLDKVDHTDLNLLIASQR
jgi:hypothetical protein